MPRFYSINFYHNRSKISLILPKATKFSSAGAPPPDPVPPTAWSSAPRTHKQPYPLQISGYATALMESARADQPQIREPQAPADLRHEGVGHFPECTTQERCKVCQKNTRIM